MRIANAGERSIQHAVPQLKIVVFAPIPNASDNTATMVNMGPPAYPQRVPQVLPDDQRMFPGRRGTHLRRRVPTTRDERNDARLARVAELVGEHQGHLVAVLFPESRRITLEECP